ncbi:MAG: hypothetical protein DHS20C18_17870 [Saprospiraceae bacterium]|nr:MAG: hypothetical protein DHS20C18_17870 [Saprospiraceae bacterium]
MLFCASFAKAQQYTPPCGTVGEMAEELIVRLLQNQATLAENDGVTYRTTQYVPVKFHLVGKNDGTGRLLEHYAFDQICALNEDYAEMDIVFYVKGGFNYIDNSVTYENHANTPFILTANKDNAAINIFCVKDATPTGDGLGTTLGYYSPGNDWIVVRNDEVGKNDATLAHELGHFFSLPHPHNGWDSEPYDVSMHGNPVQAFSPNGPPSERQDGSNGTTAGDYISDTPPDYNFGFGWNDCDYDAGTMDPSGEIVDPDEKLWMGYFLHCNIDEYYFSPIQQQLVLTDLASSQRFYIRPNYTPQHAIISETPALTYPIDGATTDNYNWVNLQWEQVPGAQFYLLEISRIASFAIDPVEVIVYGNSKIITNLQADKTYFWRVTPMNEAYTCAGSSTIGNFKTGSTTVSNQELSSVNQWSVAPNPVKANSSLTINVDASVSFTATINLRDVTGRQVRNIGDQSFNLGQQNREISLSGLSAGVYFISLDSEEGRTTKRIVVTD